MSKELLKSLLYMCRLNAGRCEQAALKSVIPILLKLNTKYPNCKNVNAYIYIYIYIEDCCINMQYYDIFENSY